MTGKLECTMKEDFKKANEQALKKLEGEISKLQEGSAKSGEKGIENMMAMINDHLTKQVKQVKVNNTNITVKAAKVKVMEDATDAMKGVITFWQNLFEQQKSQREVLQEKHEALWVQHEALQVQHVVYWELALANLLVNFRGPQNTW